MMGNSPAGMARVASGERWIPYPHLLVLNQYLRKVASGEIARLIVEIPPQCGKSVILSQYLPAWFLCRYPRKAIILSSYEESMASKWGRKSRDTINEVGRYFDVKIRDDSNAANRWEIVEHGGSMRSAGARGPISGNPADLFIIDDPIKGAIDAFSETIREANKDWYHSSCESRLSKSSAVIIGMARWHRDDLAGYLASYWTKTNQPFVKLTMSGIALKDEKYGDLFSRKTGEVLCPDMHPIEQWRPIAQSNAYWWRALYQQDPPDASAEEIFHREWFTLVKSSPPNVISRVRAWDLAASISDNAKYTVGVLLEKGADGYWYINHIVRGRWIPADRDNIILQTAQSDGIGVRVIVEEEPGSGGPAQVQYLIKKLAGYSVEPIKVSQSKMSKVLRAAPYASQCGARNVRLVQGAWVEPYLDELVEFGEEACFTDQVDASAMAFNYLSQSGSGWNPVKQQHKEYKENPLSGFGYEGPKVSML
jgi:predicted phage terminase large subunit-like protein